MDVSANLRRQTRRRRVDRKVCAKIVDGDELRRVAAVAFAAESVENFAPNDRVARRIETTIVEAPATVDAQRVAAHANNVDARWRRPIERVNCVVGGDFDIDE